MIDKFKIIFKMVGGFRFVAFAVLIMGDMSYIAYKRWHLNGEQQLHDPGYWIAVIILIIVVFGYVYIEKKSR